MYVIPSRLSLSFFGACILVPLILSIDRDLQRLTEKRRQETNSSGIPDWFDVLDEDNLPVLTEREVLRNLQAIVTDADKTDKSQVCFSTSLSNDLLTTFNRLRGVRLVFYQPRTARSGPGCAKC